MLRTVLIFTKPPRMGLAKTRLAKDLGRAEAQRINRFCASRTFQAVQDPRWHTLIHAAPDRALNAKLPLWPHRLPRVSQGQGDLGQRLARGLAAAPTGDVVFLGTDTPDVTSPLIWSAFRALLSHGAVFGPADDGGFWLFGLRKGLRTVAPFSNVRWSTEHALADVRANLEDTTIAYLPTLCDLDDGAAVRAWRQARSIARRNCMT